MTYESKPPSYYQVIDTETSVNNVGEEAVGRFKASPFSPKNNIVITCIETPECNKWYIQGDDIEEYFDLRTGKVFLVGQNIKFDLLYLMQHPSFYKAWTEGRVRVWDTMIAEYLLYGQQYKMASLDSMAERYGFPLKLDRVKEYWSQGYATEDVPPVLLREYCEQDVTVTHKIFRKQWEMMHQVRMAPLIETQMEALLALTEMEFNGMKFDKTRARMIAIRLDEQVAEMTERLKQVSELPNPLSNQQIAAFLYGGTVKETVKELRYVDGEVVRYKTGEKKGEVKPFNVTQHTEYEARCTLPSNAPSVNDATLKKVAKQQLIKPSTLFFIELLLETRKLKKAATTYFRGYHDLTWQDGCIHPTYQQTNTGTGRLSCTAPNLQNITSTGD